MDSRYFVGTLFKDSTAVVADIVTQCLTTECKSCLGSYHNEVLGHRFICRCKCHDEPKNLRGKHIARRRTIDFD